MTSRYKQMNWGEMNLYCFANEFFNTQHQCFISISLQPKIQKSTALLLSFHRCFFLYLQTLKTPKKEKAKRQIAQINQKSKYSNKCNIYTSLHQRIIYVSQAALLVPQKDKNVICESNWQLTLCCSSIYNCCQPFCDCSFNACTIQVPRSTHNVPIILLREAMYY